MHPKLRLDATLNELFLRLGILHLKPLASASLLPPVPFLLLSLIGLALIGRRRRFGFALTLTGLSLTWLSGCLGAANALAPVLLRLPPALTASRISDMSRQSTGPVGIIVLGAGVEPWAPEYGTSSLQFRSLERLRYGLWLGRKTGWPVGFTGGVGWGQPATDASVAEATAAQRIAREEFGRPLRWVEATSRDTRENALNTMALLRPAGVRRIVLVTNAWHMQRAIRNFELAIGDRTIEVEAAPMGLAQETEAAWMRWIPTGTGYSLAGTVVREWLGWLSGA